MRAVAKSRSLEKRKSNLMKTSPVKVTFFQIVFFILSNPKAGPPSHILLQKDGQMVDGKVQKHLQAFTFFKLQNIVLLYCYFRFQMRSLLEQAEEMVESDDLLEEEFNQVIFLKQGYKLPMSLYLVCL